MTIEQRLGRLERQNRWMKRIGMLGLAVAATVLLSGQAKGKDLQHLKARSLTLIDAKGKNRVVLADNGLRVSDRDGNARVALRALGDGSPSLTFWDKNGKPRVLLHALGDGSPSLELLSKHGNTRVALRVNGNVAVMAFSRSNPRADGELCH